MTDIGTFYDMMGTIDAKIVVLAAGAGATPVILQRSEPVLGKMPYAMGRYFSGNGERLNTAIIDESRVRDVLGLTRGDGLAYAANQIRLPGFQGFTGTVPSRELATQKLVSSFPGGNDGIMRHLLKSLVPAAIQGGATFGEIQNGRVDFAMLDHPQNQTRVRVSSTVINVTVGALTYTPGVNLASGTQFYWRVRANAAVNHYGPSAWSGTFTFTTP